MANPSLSEYISQSQRGLYQSIFGDGMLKKDNFSGTAFGTGTAGDASSTASIFTTTYGRKVWQALNNQTRFFNAVPRVVWGNTAGWRVRTDRGSLRSRPVEEAGTLPAVDVSNIEPVSSLPRIVATTFGASVKSVFTAQLEGGIGDVLALENENSQLDNMKEINEELLSASRHVAVAAGGATTTSKIHEAAQNDFHIGDVISLLDTNGPATETATKITDRSIASSQATFTHGAWTNSKQSAAGDILFAYSRAGITSIDDVVEADGISNGVTWPTSGAGNGPKAYDVTYARTAGAWNAAANVDYNAGVGRDLSLNALDTCIQKIRENGGEPKLILLGHDQYFKLERLLNSQQRYMGQEEYQVGVGSERTFPGTRTGLILATYMGIPILPDADVPKSVAVASPYNTLGSNVYVLDTDYLEIAIAQPTQYIENRDYFAANQLVIRGLLYTMGEMRCRNFFVQAKIGDLNA